MAVPASWFMGILLSVVSVGMLRGGLDGGSASGGVLTGHGLAIRTVVPLLGPMQICLPNGLYAPGAVTGGGGGGTPHEVDYVWDTGTNGIGRLAEIDESSGTTTTYSYGDRGNVLTETRDIGASEYVTSYAWDLADNLTRITWPGGEAVDYIRDDLGRVTRVDFIVGKVMDGLAYDPFGPETDGTLTLGDLSLASARSFVLDGRLDQTTLHEDTEALHDLTFVYDDAGRLDTRTDDNDGTPVVERFTYDVVSRLKTAADGAYGSLTYTYDAVGNRLERSHDDGTTITTVTSTIDPLSNRITDHGGNTVTHDGAGRMTGQTVGGQAHVYAYGLDGRLASATVGRATATYRHNALGQRIEATRSGTTTHIHYDLAGRRIAETDGAGVLIRAWIWLDGRPVIQVRPDGSGGHVLAAIAGDQLHQPLQLIEDDGGTPAGPEVSFTRVSLPFGGTDSLTANAGVDEPTRLPGQYEDPATGLHYNYHRDLDPLLGRYLQPDPIGLAGGDVNLYAYVWNDALNWIDPYGLDVQLCCKQISQLPVLRGNYHCYVSRVDPDFPHETTIGLHGSGNVGTIYLNDLFDKGHHSGKMCGPLQPDLDDKIWQCALTKIWGYPKPSYYDLLGPNSNTFAGICSGDCGIQPPPIASTSAPGFSAPPAGHYEVPTQSNAP